MGNKLSECLFTNLIGVDPSLKIEYDFDRDTNIVMHDENLFMASYRVTDEFIWDNGISKFNELTSQQQILIAHDFNYTKKVLKKIPVLASEKVQNTEDFIYFTVQEYERSSVDNTLKYDNVLSSINSLCGFIGIGNEILLAPIFMIQNKISNIIELNSILTELHNDGMIIRKLNQGTKFTVSITAKGSKYLKAHNLKSSKKVFIASQFNWSKKGDPVLTDQSFKDFIDTIKQACSECGYEGDIVKQNHTNFITDEIIKGIRESKFVISDFTFNNSGVYFEAGFARGLDKAVIHIVNKNHVNDLHFDIKQINYIAWDDLSILKDDLVNRIKAINL